MPSTPAPLKGDKAREPRCLRRQNLAKTLKLTRDVNMEELVSSITETLHHRRRNASVVEARNIPLRIVLTQSLLQEKIHLLLREILGRVQEKEKGPLPRLLRLRKKGKRKNLLMQKLFSNSSSRVLPQEVQCLSLRVTILSKENSSKLK